MRKYTKAIVAVLAAILEIVAIFFGFDIADKGVTAESIWALVIPFLAAFGVYQGTNKQA